MSKKFAFFLTAFLIITMVLNAQVKSLPDTSKLAYNDISKKLGLVVFPSKGQAPSQQKKDEFECYKWAMDQSGVDPLADNTVKAEQVDTSPDGTGVKKAAGGALVGLAIGSVSGHAGEGAAIGAGVGAVRGAKQHGYVNARKQQEANEAAQAKQKSIADSYKKAYTVCMEGKGYAVQ